MFLWSLEEAENERMHLMTALELKQPGVIFRGAILLAQGMKPYIYRECSSYVSYFTHD